MVKEYKNFICDFKKYGYCDIFQDKKYIGYFNFDYNNKYVFRSTCDLFDRIEYIWQSQNDKITSLNQIDDLFQQVKKGIDFYIEYQKQLIKNTIENYQFYIEIDNFSFDLTCSSCPQQYEVYKDNEYIGYIRIRHGYATFSNYPLGNIVYLYEQHEENNTKTQQINFLKYCIQKYLNYNKGVK